MKANKELKEAYFKFRSLPEVTAWEAYCRAKSLVRSLSYTKLFDGFINDLLRTN